MPGSAPLLDGLILRDGEGYDPADLAFNAGGLLASGASPHVVGCRFVRNRGRAAFYSQVGSPILEDTRFEENGIESPQNYALRIENPQGALTLDRITIIGNRFNGMYLYGEIEPTIVDCTFRGNAGQALDCSSDCTIVGSEFIANGGRAIRAGGQPSIFDSRFLGNLDSAVFTFGGALVVNSVFAGNTADFAAAVECGSAYILNSTFCGNSARGVGGVWVSGNSTIRNSIFWSNWDEGGFSQQAQFTTYKGTSVINVDHSIVHGWTGGWGGAGNSGVDPLFVDAYGPDDIAGTGDDDLRLLPGSLAINAGDPDETYLPATDLDGHARVLCGRVDIGAYEFGIGDYDCNQTVDLTDFANWESCMTGPQSAIGNGQLAIGCEPFDFNADAAVDLLDFFTFQHLFADP